MKTTIIVIIIIILAAVGVYAYNKSQNERIGDASKFASINAENIKASDIKWTFEDKGTNAATGIPSTGVSVNILQNTFAVGTYDGTCVVREDSSLETNELTGVLCWYAGVGDEIGVYKAEGKLIIKHREVQEGTAEAPGFKGAFKSLLSI